MSSTASGFAPLRSVHALLVACAALNLSFAPAETPVVGFVTSGQWTTEGARGARVIVELSEVSATEVVVPFTISGSATAGRDYVAPAGPIVIAPGLKRGNLFVDILEDTETEPVETLLIELGQPAGAVLGGRTAHTLGIGVTVLGGPADGLTQGELDAFNRGKVLFEKRFTPREGLGPFYNAVSCASCHSKPVTGGTAELYRNFYLAVYQFGATPNSQSTSIPPFLSQVVPAYGSGDLHADAQFTLEGGRPLLPSEVLGFPVIAAQRNSIPIFGVGQFEFISNATISANADPNDLNADGISGRVNTALGGTAMGRFGVKSQSNNVELFTRAPLQNQMGITTNPFLGAGSIVSMARAPLQASGNPNDPTIDGDGVPDPELSHDDLGDLIAFTRFLAPPEPLPFSPDAVAGEALFAQARCTDCHIPSLPSSKGPVNAYTDLLLHFMGPDLVDNMKFGESSTAITDFRTAPLWGISMAAPYLHDGRAPTLRDAILAHDGEGAISKNLFLALSAAEQDQVIVFLEHL